MSKKVFVGNLNFDTSEELLRTTFAATGAVTDVYMPLDRETGRRRGFAFVTFGDESQVTAAIEQFDGFELDGRALRVNVANEQPPRRERPSAPREFNDYGGGDRYNDRHHDRYDEPPKFKRGGGSRRGLRGRKRDF